MATVLIITKVRSKSLLIIKLMKQLTLCAINKNFVYMPVMYLVDKTL